MANYLELKNKFTDEKGNYIFNLSVSEMEAKDLIDYIEFKRIRMNKAGALYDKIGSFRIMGNLNKKQREYAEALRLLVKRGLGNKNDIDFVKLTVGGV